MGEKNGMNLDKTNALRHDADQLFGQYMKQETASGREGADVAYEIVSAALAGALSYAAAIHLPPTKILEMYFISCKSEMAWEAQELAGEIDQLQPETKGDPKAN